MNQALDCPSSADVLAGLKDFQRRTAEYAFRRLYIDSDSTRRFLVADEVGLGKTHVARGVIAKAVEHLWDKVDRIDVIYVCSNSEIARQNIDRLCLDKENDFASTTRATLLPIELKGLGSRRVNYVSMTPGTSLEPRGGTGIKKERALLQVLLENHWGLQENRAARVLRCDVDIDGFRDWIQWIRDQEIDRGLHQQFLQELDRRCAHAHAEGHPDFRERLEKLCDVMPRRDSSLSFEDRAERRKLVSELRTILGRTCIHALRPDLVILDEFQRFKHLLDAEDEDAELARSLLEFADERNGVSEAVRVLLLSATPYKMYTLQHEHDRGDADHYEDFIATYDFLTAHKADENSALQSLLKQYRSAMFRGKGAIDELRTLKAELELRLRRVMARTERLALTTDRSGMLREQHAQTRLLDSDVQHYTATAGIASVLELGEIVEYWKSAPYLLNFMDEYELKRAFQDAIGSGDEGAVAKALAGREYVLLGWDDVQAYRKLDPANAKIRFLVEHTLDQGLWKLLWLPPTLSYFQLSGVYGQIDLRRVTKRLVFSSWKIVPKVIAAIVSYEAERRAIALLHSDSEGEVSIENSTEGRKKIAPLLRFTRSEGRLTGMPVLGLIYPSMMLAQIFDPATCSTPPPPADQVIQHVRSLLAPMVESIISRWAMPGEVDERWYWAAPILLDLANNAEANEQFWEMEWLAAEWSGEDETVDADGEHDTESAWAEHVDAARSLLRDASSPDRRPLGSPPGDLLDVLARAAIGSPGVVALRAIARTNGGNLIGSERVRVAAGWIAWRLRGLFNLPEVISLIRGHNREEPYWLRAIEYAIDGCLQAVLDEFSHVLHGSLGAGKLDPVETAEAIAGEMWNVIGLRSAAVGLDDIRLRGSSPKLTIEPRRMRARIAARFAQGRDESDNEATRSDQVRAAFNSPFWPFVLATTSVGQEGLDFHHYCHAIVHWNLPSNPVDLEQREGRIHRFKGHAVRKNVAQKYGPVPVDPHTDRWATLFQQAEKDRDPGMNELVPYWLYPIDGGSVIERYVPTLPLSRDAERFASLRGALALYRMVFGQPRQDELVRYLSANLDQSVVQELVKELRIDLEPPAILPHSSTPV